jgi:hypothetical protein
LAHRAEPVAFAPAFGNPAVRDPVDLVLAVADAPDGSWRSSSSDHPRNKGRRARDRT